MSLNNTINVKDLPQAEEIVTGNYILLEDETGTKIIDFKNFVIGPANTSFYNAIVTNIRAVSAYCDSLSGTIGRFQRQTIAAVNTEFETLTSNFSQRFPSFFIKTGTISINPNAKSGFSTFSSTLPNIETVDINVVQTVFDFSSLQPVATFFILLEKETILDAENENIYNYTLTLSALSTYPTSTIFNYKVLKTY